MNLKRRVERLQSGNRYIKVEDLLADIDAEARGEKVAPRSGILHPRLMASMNDLDGDRA
tara:strand:+ start:15021 stop:15197 length:177 start_codon:yes stop_codon:yes gene_type:complete